MSLFDCIGRAMADPEVRMDRARGEQAQALFNELRARYRREFGEDAADAMAAADVKRAMRERAAQKKRETLINLQAMRRLDRHLDTHRGPNGGEDLADAVQAPLTASHVGAIDSVESRASTLRGWYFAQMADVLTTFRRNIAGVRQGKALMRDFMAGLSGEPAAGPAAALAEAARAVTKRARADYNAAGGNMGELDDFGVPHVWSRDRIRGNEAAFREEVRQRADWTRIVDPTTGRAFADPGVTPTPERVADFLDAVVESISSDGWARRRPVYNVRGLGSGRPLEHARVLHFKSADDWLAVNERFGASDPYTALLTHVDAMAKRTALMQVFGANPRAGFSYLEQAVRQRAERTNDPALLRRVKNATHRARAQLDVLDGRANTPVDDKLAAWLAGGRDLLVSAQLGGAMLSAAPDVGFIYAAAREVGMSGRSTLGRMVRLMADGRSRDQALRMGAIATHLAQQGSAQARFLGEAWSPEATRVVTDTVLRASGLTAWTDLGRHAFQIEFMAHLADNAHLRLDALPEPLRKLFGERGVTPEIWDAARAAELHVDAEGATYLAPMMIAQTGDEAQQAAAMRLMAIIHEQTEFAVPSASLRGRAALGGEDPPGTFKGELLRSGLMYKSFALSLMWHQSRRVAMREGAWSKAGYLAQLAAMTTIMGAAAIQMKEIAKGRDPRAMDDGRFLGAAVLQGGGLGIFGDFLAAETNRFGGGIESTVTGPMLGAVGDLIALGSTAVGARDGNVGREATWMLRRYTPGGSLWYASTAWNRMVLDEVQRILDPEADRAFRESERRRVRDYGNRSWWRPGQALPDRAPAIGVSGG